MRTNTDLGIEGLPLAAHAKLAFEFRRFRDRDYRLIYYMAGLAQPLVDRTSLPTTELRINVSRRRVDEQIGDEETDHVLSETLLVPGLAVRVHENLGVTVEYAWWRRGGRRVANRLMTTIHGMY